MPRESAALRSTWTLSTKTSKAPTKPSARSRGSGRPLLAEGQPQTPIREVCHCPALGAPEGVLSGRGPWGSRWVPPRCREIALQTSREGAARLTPWGSRWVPPRCREIALQTSREGAARLTLVTVECLQPRRQDPRTEPPWRSDAVGAGLCRDVLSSVGFQGECWSAPRCPCLERPVLTGRTERAGGVCSVGSMPRVLRGRRTQTAPLSSVALG